MGEMIKDTQAHRSERVEAIKEKLRAVLADHKVKTTDIQAMSGPSVTTYKIYPVGGVSCAKIMRLQDDIELSLNAGGVRVVTLPDSVGVEVANEHPSIVPLKSLLEDAAFRESKAALPVAISRDAQGNPKIIDLAQASHILMAGATKQGKTEAVHSLILSLLCSRTPGEVKFVLIDPKNYELEAYKTLRREYIAELPDVEKKAVLTSAEEAEKSLRSLCLELEKRYETLSEGDARNIRQYNAEAKEKMPYIVAVVDEFADLTVPMWGGRKNGGVLNYIVRLAQTGRAVGIHLVITTQRPSPAIITGAIKANFPTRLAFRTAARQDSFAIIDVPGAERLIGGGEMLLECGGEITRVQGAHVDEKDIDAVIRAIGSRQCDGKIHDTPYCLPSVEDAGAESSGSGGTTCLHNIDDRFEEAARLVVTTQIGSASHLQLKLGIGYARAGKLTDQLEAAGIVGPLEGTKPGKVLVRTIDELEKKLKAYNDPESVI